jgi:hypothetical protein
VPTTGNSGRIIIMRLFQAYRQTEGIYLLPKIFPNSADIDIRRIEAGDSDERLISLDLIIPGKRHPVVAVGELCHQGLERPVSTLRQMIAGPA